MCLPSLMRASALCFVLLAGCVANPSSAPPPVSLEGERTWYGAIGPLVGQRCALCHRPGEIGPFPLETYEQVKGSLALVRDAVASKAMPPFPPEQSEASGCPPIDDGRKMSDAERAFLIAWLDDGAPEGERRELPRPQPAAPLGAPSDVWPMPEAYTTRGVGDEYRCMLLEPKHVAALPVAALSVLPGNRAIVHHSAIYLIPADQLDAVRQLDRADEGVGFDCFGGVGVERAYPAGLWVPGNDAPLVPPRGNVGYYFPVGWGVVVQQHYFSTQPQQDTSSVALWRGGFVFPEVPYAGVFGDVSFSLPPRSKTTIETTTVVRPADSPYALFNQANAGSVYAVWAHMHLRGQAMEMDVIRPDGTEQCLLRIPRWDFHWQSIYRLANPVAVKAGETIRVRCHFDNVSNEPISYGENTGDEMCFATISMTGR